MAFGSFDNVWAGSFAAPFDMVAARGGEAEVMFEKAIASLGGMKAFVKKNQTVVVKPNIGWDVTPEKAANTNPNLVAKIVQHCLQAGAKEVFVFDNTCDNWQKCYTNSGIEKAVKDAGGKIVSGKSESYYQEVKVPKGVKLKNAKVHELILSSDVFINVPVLKSHGGATLSMSMKNLMGVVWDRGFWHKNDLHQCIADFATYRKPDLNIVDAYRVMKKNGPRGVSVEDVVTMKAQLIGKDIVAIDAAATKLFGLEPSSIGHIVNAEKLGLGTTNLDKLNINRIKV
ncbi:MAG TPA: DUF362 domain-containing protein [Bacteroidales bacterium]|nr:DUF362 domain-containing protein [Bacteroidales bacterium]